MTNLFNGLFDCVKKKKGLFVFLLIGVVAAIVLGVITALNFGGGVFEIDLTSISYIKFLKGETGFVSLIFNMILSLTVFLLIIVICSSKKWLCPIAITFYLYLIYSQVVIFLSVILIYGFFNCIIFALLLLIYDIVVWVCFTIIMLELSLICGDSNYFKNCFSCKECKLLIFLTLYVVAIIIFSFTLMILKNYVVLLIY